MQPILLTSMDKLEKVLLSKFGSPHRGAPGGQSFYNPRTGRTFHIHKHPDHMNGRAHVDIRRRGAFPERQYLLNNRE